MSDKDSVAKTLMGHCVPLQHEIFQLQVCSTCRQTAHTYFKNSVLHAADALQDRHGLSITHMRWNQGRVFPTLDLSPMT